MTPRELFYLTDGLRWREENEMERIAWLAHVLLSAWVQNPPSIAVLLGKAPPPDDLAIDQ